jgi:hypothetical protein
LATCAVCVRYQIAERKTTVFIETYARKTLDFAVSDSEQLFELGKRQDTVLIGIVILNQLSELGSVGKKLAVDLLNRRAGRGKKKGAGVSAQGRKGKK